MSMSIRDLHESMGGLVVGSTTKVASPNGFEIVSRETPHGSRPALTNNSSTDIETLAAKEHAAASREGGQRVTNAGVIPHIKTIMLQKIAEENANPTPTKKSKKTTGKKKESLENILPSLVPSTLSYVPPTEMFSQHEAIQDKLQDPIVYTSVSFVTDFGQIEVEVIEILEEEYGIGLRFKNKKEIKFIPKLLMPLEIVFDNKKINVTYSGITFKMQDDSRIMVMFTNVKEEQD